MSKTNGMAEVGGVMLTVMDLKVISHHLRRIAVQLPTIVWTVLTMFQGLYSH